MSDAILASEIPVLEKVLKDVSKNVVGVIPKFSEKEPTLAVKELRAILGPILDTADSADLSPSHRAAAYNLVCAIIEKCQASDAQYAHEALLDSFIWTRLFEIYLVRSDNAKGKSTRQVLLVLTGVLLKNANEQSSKLQDWAATTFLDIICQRQDRVKVKPALQGLAHFIQKGLISVTQLVDVYTKLLEQSSRTTEKAANAQSLLSAFISWVVHHDTSLSAGHLIKNFLVLLRRSDQQRNSNDERCIVSIWIPPVIETLRLWPDRIQEFKTHVFPHCFLPELNEYFQFLSYLGFERHVAFAGPIPAQLKILGQHDGSLEELDEFRILLAAIETGKELGIVKDLDYRVCRSVDIYQNALHLPDNVFGGWLSHAEPEVRLAGLHLSIYTSAITKPITGGVFESLKRNMVHLHADTDANFRRDLLSYIQKLFNRLRGSTATLARGSAKSSPASQNRLPFPTHINRPTRTGYITSVQDPLSESLRFIIWYMKLIEWDLRSEASYQRRITAVRALLVVLKSGIDPRVPHHLLSKGAQGQLHWVHGLRIPNSNLMRSLLDLILDPFDDVRDASVLTLQLCLESLPDDEKKEYVTKLPLFIGRAEAAMLRTGRADQADGVARAYSLLYTSSSQSTISNGTSRLAVLSQLHQQLKETLIVASTNISEAVNGRPVHGTFAAIRYIMDQEGFYQEQEAFPTHDYYVWKKLHDEILNSIELLWSCVTDTLCADAPEGHLPEELEEETNLDTKEVLSYSWRGLKEASILLRVIITKAPVGTTDRAILTPDSFVKLGNLCFTQLVELRHRGAFSTVAQTFAAFCRRCVSANEQVLCALPEQWYKETLSTIKAKADTITRRSGGLPALMAGIVAAEPQPGGRLFSWAMRDLIIEASIDAQSSNIEESRLPQVHALNCIKEFFMSSRLSVASESYMSEGLELAARTLNSKIWPIRNCSLMLFKALIERLLGSDEAQDWKEHEGTRTSRFSYDNYPSLISIIQKLLDPEGPLKETLDTPDSISPMDLHGAEGVFPALQILRQASPPVENRQVILKSVMKLFGSPHWHLRDMAARTAMILHQPGEYQSVIESLLECSDESANAQHGALLCARYMLHRLLHDTTNYKPHMFTEILLKLRETVCKHVEHACPFIKVAELDLVTLCGTAIARLPFSTPVVEAWLKLTTAVSIGAHYDLGHRSPGDSTLFQQFLVRAFTIDRVILQWEFLDVRTSKDYQRISDALILLARDDPDTCSTALEILDDVIQLKTPKGPLMMGLLILLNIFPLIQDTLDPEVLSKAQFVLANGLSRPGMVKDVLDMTREHDLLSILDKLQSQCLQSSPSNMRGALHLLGFFLDYTYSKYPAHRKTMLEKIAQYIRLLRMTMADTNPFDDRFAAVQSVAALNILWTLDPSSKDTSPLLLGLVFILYDMLNDDDNEIKHAASIATTRLLQAQSTTPGRAATKPTVPILATHRLAKFLITFSTSPNLYREAIRRLTGTPSRVPLFNTPFADLFAQTRKEDTALFATEKQNLYKDDTLDAALWSRVLSSLPSNAMPSLLRSSLTMWVLEALAVLTTAAQNEVDGALGWTAKPEMFTLGMRVFCAAEVVLTCAPMSAEASQVRRMMREFADAGKAGEVHGLWVDKVDRVLAKSVVAVLKYSMRKFY